MRGVFDDREFERSEAPSETELTLGSTTLLLIAFGLALLCGLCFSLGYVAGHRGAQPSVVSLPSPDVSATLDANNGRAKPSADAQPAPEVTSTDTEPDDQRSSPSSVSAPGEQNRETSHSATESNEVKPALDAVITNPPTGLPAASAVARALPSAGSIMVQIAAVSQPEDADVLVSALRKHGYAVGARREPLDGLIHVRIGPFQSSDEAEKSRQKLLSDGYNAIVQP
ncbi:MAG TPA: SPOR domain-containing protein [Terracidiphilus sp.]|jgi:DedD protein